MKWPMLTGRFWLLASERAVKTFAQTLVAVFGVGGITLLSAPWTTALATAGMAALLSVLTSVASEPLGEGGTPNALPAAPAPTAVSRS